MYVFRNVNEAYHSLVVEGLSMTWSIETSRNGPVLKMNDPMIVCYTNPLERVLFHTGRNANPFFHLFESLWMLAGRNDLKPLQYYVSDFDKYSDDGLTLNGAYGYRWRHADTSVEERDQLDILVEHLRDMPGSRRAVLQMWNVEDDLMNIYDSKDLCCNLSVCFSIRDQIMYYRDQINGVPGPTAYKVLDMTVFNRSNDLIFGMLGANVVHFSFLQEYMAARIGVGVGKYYQVSNNLHMYKDSFKQAWRDYDEMPTSVAVYHIYSPSYKHFPLIESVDPGTGIAEVFDTEVAQFIDDPEGHYHEPFLRDVAAPMALAYRHHKEREYGLALEALEYVRAEDWKIAGISWINKRKTNWEAKQNG